jgi:hypothetical protein
LKFDCEKLAQEKIEVHRQYVMVNEQEKKINPKKFISFVF